jgi:two-component system cell cycle sensor histidine kinase/response regulator CckA
VGGGPQLNEPTFQESIPAQKQEEQHIRAQHDLALALNATTNLKQGLELCLETALTVSGMDCGGIYVVDEASNTLELLAYRGLRPEFIECSSSYNSESANYILVMRGTPVYCTYSELDLPKNQVHRNEGLRSFALIPVQYEKQIICCLNLASHTSDQIDKNSRDVLETIAAQIASAIARLKVETELRESEDKYRELFELESDAIFLIRNDTGRIIEANSAATSLYGYTHRELLSLKNTDLSAEPEDTRRVTTTTPVLKDTIIKIPLRFHRKKDGTVFPVEITGRFF